VIETIGEGLEIDIGGIHRSEEFGAGLRINIAGRDGDRLDAAFAARSCDVDRVLEENDRIVVGVGDAAAADLDGRFSETLGRSTVGERIHLAGLAHIPVLAELAGQVAAGGAKRQHAAAGIEMIERLFLDRVDAESR
jgi:hypothetical protein